MISRLTRNAAQLAIVILVGIAASTWLFGSSFSIAGNAIGRALPVTITICVGAILFRLLYVALAGPSRATRIVAGMTLASIVLGYFGFLWLLTAGGNPVGVATS